VVGGVDNSTCVAAGPDPVFITENKKICLEHTFYKKLLTFGFNYDFSGGTGDVQFLNVEK